MRLSADTRRVGDVTLVAARVTNPLTERRRVRVANRLDGPVWPPRTGGQPASGWDDGGFEGVLAPGETRALGYATAGPPADPPLVVAWTERAPAGRSPEPHAGVLVDRLGDPRPPRDAVPTHTPDTAIPAAVDAWLDGVRERAAADALTDEDDRALAAVGDAVRDVREDA